jgi:hypothetical protein
MKYIVVEGCQFEIYEGGVLNSSGIVSVDSSSIVSAKSKIDSKGIYTKLNVTVSSFSSSVVPGWVPLSGSTTTPVGVSIPGQISSSSQYNTEDGSPVYLEGDQAVNVTIYGKVQSGQTQTDATTTITIKIKSAGQTNTKGD